MALKSSNKIDTNKVEIVVTVDAATFTDACTKAFMKQRKSIQIPGFRKGKVTQGMAEKVYGEGAFYEDALDIVYPEAVQGAIEEAGLRIVAQPEIKEVSTISKAEGVEMTLEITTYPEVKLGDYKGLEAKMLDTEVTDEEVAEELKNMQDRNSRLISVEDGTAEMGDTVDLDFEGFVDGVAFEGGKGENYPLELGSNSFIPGFEEQIVGQKIDEGFVVKVTFPEDYVENLAGKDAEFKCTIHEIKRKELPVLDDEFAKDVSSEVETLDELKGEIKNDIAEKKAKQAETDFENQLIEQVVENMEVEIPETMFESKCDEMVQDYAYRIQMQGIDLNTYLQYMGQTMDDFKAQMMDGAKQNVKVELALEAIIDAEKLTASEEEIDAEIEKLAKQYDMEAEQIKKSVPAETIARDINFKKAVDFIVENAKKA